VDVTDGVCIVTKSAFAVATALLMALARVAFADSHSQGGSGAGTERTASVRISDVQIAIAARACLAKGMTLHVVRENGKPVATKCIADLDRTLNWESSLVSGSDAKLESSR
jgi:hypothetical protein